MSSPAFESLQWPISPEAACLATLLGLEEMERFPAPRPVTEFYESLHDTPAPSDLQTTIRLIVNRPNQPQIWDPDTVPEVKLEASVTVGFEPNDNPGYLRFDFFCKDKEEGLVAFRRELQRPKDDPHGFGKPVHTQRLEVAQLEALTRDAEQVRQWEMSKRIALLALEPFTVPAEPDGTQRFHIIDILSAMLNRRLRPERIDASSALIAYMRARGSSQLTHEDIAARLKALHGETLGSLEEMFAAGLPDQLDLYAQVGQVAQRLETFFLAVEPLEQEHPGDTPTA